MTAGGLDEFAHLRQLVESALCVDENAAAQLLAKLDVRCVNGVFSRTALARALGGATASALDPAVSGKSRRSPDPGLALTEALGAFGLRPVAISSGRTRLTRLIAISATRTITVETTGAPLLIDAERGVQARVYVATERRNGQAVFLAGGLTDAESPVYLFALPREGRFWIARREDLATYDAELRAQVKGQRGRRRYSRAGVAPHTSRVGYVRVWIGLGGLPGFEPHLRIADEHGHLLSGCESWTGGRP